MAIGIYISIILLNVNGLNAPTKRLAKCIQKQDLYTCCLQATHFRSRDSYRLKVREWKKVFYSKWVSKERWSNNPHIRQNRPLKKNITRDKEGHYIMIKGSIQEEDIKIANIYAPIIRAPQCIR